MKNNIIKYSISTKLIISVSFITTLLTVLLSVSTILIFNEDKRAYIFESQSNYSLQTSKQFDLLISETLNTTKNMLSSLTLSAPLDQRHRIALQTFLDNQDKVLIFKVILIASKEKKIAEYIDLNKKATPEETNQIKMVNESISFSPEWLANILPYLQEHRYAFINLAIVNGMPALGIIFLDSYKYEASIALAVISLKDFMFDSSDRSISIVSLDGSVLFDSRAEKYYSKGFLNEDPLFQKSINNKINNGTFEYYNDKKKLLGSYTKSNTETIILSRVDWNQANKASLIIIERFILLGSILLALAIIAATIYAKTLTSPIEKIYDATKKISDGDFNIKVNISSQDEIGALTGSFNSMSEKILDLIEKNIEKTKLENEIQIASTIQKTLLPTEIYEDDHIFIEGYYQTASQCGGDYWGYFKAEENVVIMIADATGHGFSSALITAAARSYFSMVEILIHHDPETYLCPAKILSLANKIIFDTSAGKILMTALVSIINPIKKTMTFANAGHNKPLLLRQEDNECKSIFLTEKGGILGLSNHLIPYKKRTILLKEDDTITFYTDGLVECTNTEGVMYGKNRLKSNMMEWRNTAPTGALDNLVKDLNLYRNQPNFEDDVTIVVTKIKS